MNDLIPNMADLIPEGMDGEVEILHRIVDEAEASLSRIRAAFSSNNGLEMVYPGKYAVLKVGKEIMMSDTRMERQSNSDFLYQANGKVLVAGLGIGMILVGALKKPEVESVVVVEKMPEVIRLVWPYVKNEKVQLIEADIFEAKPTLKKLGLFDTIYFDIWANISTDNLPEISRLHHMYKNLLNRQNPKAWMGSWQQDYLRYKRREERKYDFSSIFGVTNQSKNVFDEDK